MNCFILATFVLAAVIASPTLDVNSSGSEKAAEYVKIPDGFGGMKYVNVNDEALNEIDPHFDIPNEVLFRVHTRLNPTVPQFVQFNDMSSVLASNFVSNRDTKFVIHGWQNVLEGSINPITTAAYLQAGDVNVIVVDWTAGYSINYITSRNHVNNVGAHVATFINNMVAAGIITHNHITCAGQSLGSHVCGATGKRVVGGRLNSIFGVDPAGPLFSYGDPANRLAEDDALYTECIHTDIVALGIGDAICQADFYPNGGTNQPGCATAVCDHAIAANYFAESVNSPALWGRRCATLADKEANNCPGNGYSMGGFPSNQGIFLRGIFRMPTNADSPFGMGPF